MAFQDETPSWTTVYQWETTDAAQGGLGGLANRPLLELTHRTAYLKAHMDAVEAVQAGQRIVATGPVDLYVATSGNDGNAGDVSHPFLTIQRAVTVLYSRYDLAGQQATIHVADGTYTAGAVFTSMPPGAANAIAITGNVTTPGNVVVNVTNGCPFIAFTGASIAVRGMSLLGSGTATGQGIALYANSGGAITFDKVAFGACAVAHMASIGGIIASINASYTIAGNSPAHALAGSNGSVTMATPTITIVGTPAFSTAFAQCTDAEISFVGASFSGSATGPRYAVAVNGVIVTNGGGASFFPGNSAGAAATGGQYV